MPRVIPRPLDAVLFDMDGLLLDTEAVHRVTMAETAAIMGVPFPDTLFQSLVGVHREMNRLQLAAHYGPGFALDAFYEDSDRRFTAALASTMPLRPGAREILDHLVAAGIPRGLVTSTASPFAEDRLRRAELFDLFDTVVTRSDVVHPKPAPDPYLLGLERLGARASHSVALEDSVNGVRAAAAAGLVTIMIPDILSATDETNRLTAATLDSLHAVRALLAEIDAEGDAARLSPAPPPR